MANVGETCVTVTWLQFNAQLLRLTGEARFAEQLEHVVLNQLFGAQRCDGSAWGYYVQMEGKKPYSSTLDGHCCLSSGPRGVALIPTFAVTTDADGVVVNLYDAGTAKLTLRDGTPVTLTTDTHYPGDERIRITVDPAEPKTFAVKVRIPAWCRKLVGAGQRQAGQRQTPGRTATSPSRANGSKGDRIELQFKLEPRVVVGDHKNQGKVAVLYGPLVLAADEALLGATNRSLERRFRGWARASPRWASRPSRPRTRSNPGPAPRSSASTRSPASAPGGLKAGAPLQIRLIPFADAGATGTSYKVWLPLGLASSSGNVLLDGQESRSRPGNVGGSIIDEDLQSFVVTFNNQPRRRGLVCRDAGRAGDRQPRRVCPRPDLPRRRLVRRQRRQAAHPGQDRQGCRVGDRRANLRTTPPPPPPTPPASKAASDSPASWRSQ